MPKRAVTIRDIARKVDMSEATVSLALNDNSMVKSETRELIKKVADELGYVPNLYARRLVGKKSGIIGLVVPDIENIYYSSFVKELSDKMAKSGFSLSIFISSNSPEKEARAIRDMIASKVEGIVYVPINLPVDLSASTKLISSAEIPTVCATAYTPNMNCVYCDLENGMRRLMETILESNPKKTVYFTSQNGVWTIDCRTKAFLSSIPETVEHEIICLDSIDYKAAYEAAGKLINSPPDAIVCVNDFVALGVINRLIFEGIDIPGKVSVAGFDNSIFSITSPIPLTTVDQDIRELANETSKLILNLVKTPSAPVNSVVIPTKIIKRNSTKGKIT